MQTLLLDSATAWTVSSPTNKTLSKPIPAIVPGQIHLDLHRAGLIDAPYYRMNDVVGGASAFATLICILFCVIPLVQVLL
jgi:hypothetical protein